jgi:hypothetical protein
VVKLPAATSAAERPAAQHGKEETYKSFAAGAADIGRATPGARQTILIDLWLSVQFHSALHGEYHVTIRQALAFYLNPGYKCKLANLYRGILKVAARRTGWVAALTLALAYGWIALRGPQGLPALIEKHREIRRLEEQNAIQAHANQLLWERVQRLKNSPSEQEMEIRKQLKLLRPGETEFIIPDAPK